MGQLDLFGLGPQPEASPKKKAKRSIGDALENEVENVEITNAFKEETTTPDVGNPKTANEPQPVLSVTEQEESAAALSQPNSANEAEILPAAEEVDEDESAQVKESTGHHLPSENTLETKNTSVDQDDKNNNPVVFTDGKIGVKFKVKRLQEVEPPPEVFEVVEVERPQIVVQRITQKRGRKSFKEIDACVDLIEVPEDEILYQKQYYPISTVATWFKVNTSLLRFWENEFDILKPRKNRKGDRMFRPEDVKNLQLIHHLLREKKYTIDGAREFLKGNRKKAETQLQLTQTLQKFKSFLLELKANLQP
jgi:DNA-binding transcriptional MerR regulator